jgi:hypothetical protein
MSSCERSHLSKDDIFGLYLIYNWYHISLRNVTSLFNKHNPKQLQLVQNTNKNPTKI